jgi:hypothetical protein
MEVVELILKSMPFHELKHPVGTIMRMADSPLHFEPKYVPPDAESEEHVAEL